MGDCTTDTPSISSAFSLGLNSGTFNAPVGSSTVVANFASITNSNTNVLELVNPILVTLDSPGLYLFNFIVDLTAGTIGDTISIGLLENGVTTVSFTNIITLSAAAVPNVPGSIIYNNLVAGTTIQMRVNTASSVTIDFDQLTIVKL